MQWEQLRYLHDCFWKEVKQHAIFFEEAKTTRCLFFVDLNKQVPWVPYANFSHPVSPLLHLLSPQMNLIKTLRFRSADSVVPL